jgi:hypothetical protein
LRDKNASIFDRSVPIDYKHSMINFEIKQNITKNVADENAIDKNVVDKRNIYEEADQEKEDAEKLFPKGSKLVEEMKVNFEIAKEYSKKNKVQRGDDDWYKHCGIVLQKMAKDYPVSKEYLIGYIVAHLLEVLLFEDKVEVMNYLYYTNNMTQNSFEWFLKEYFETNSIITKNFTAFIMYDLNKRIIMILNENNKWVIAEPEDQREIASSKETKEYLTLQINDYNKIIGFIGYEKKNRYFVFKTKDLTAKRDTGARCDEAGKNKTLTKINAILGEEKYTNENTKIIKEKNGTIISEAIGNTELCVLQEFILRYFNTIKKNDKKWFVIPEMAIWHKFYTVFV